MTDWIAEIDDAAGRIKGYVRRTAVTRLNLSGLDRPIEVKLEFTQHTGSFKARGAFNTLLSGGVPEGGVVAASGGNHGAAVAYAAARLGIPARIFVPEMAGPTKIALIERTGPRVGLIITQGFESTVPLSRGRGYGEGLPLEEVKNLSSHLNHQY